MPDPCFAAVGDNCIDCYLPPVGDCLVGGNAVNVAVHLARLGRQVSYFGAVGGDAAGEAVRGALADRGVDVTGLRCLPGEDTGRTDIETLANGERRFVFEDFGACLRYQPHAGDISCLCRMSHIHVGWIRGAVDLRRALRHSGATISQDLSVNNSPDDLDPAGLDVAFSSADPGQADAESERLLARGAKLAVVTLGAAGCLARNSAETRRMAALPVAVSDTTGAGDSFIAGFLDAMAKHLNLNDCLAAGAQAGALACQYRGGFPQGPLQPFVHDRRS